MIPEAGRDTVSQLAGLCLPQVPRALALMDRDVLSPTYGSMDRAYWYYRTLTNFPGAVWQQPMVGLAAVVRATHADNPHLDDPVLIEAARAALLAWTRTQHPNGAFDEWYRNEHSYCPTAITAAGAAVALDLLGGAIDVPSRERVLAALRRAGRWLAPRYNAGVMNQNLAAAVALAGLARLDGDSSWRAHASRLLQRIAADQSTEGWFPEYGGLDFGYSTLALDLLALSDGFGFSEYTGPMAERLAGFLIRVLDPNRAMPGRVGSRGTAHAFPFGAMTFSARIPAARTLAGVLLSMHASGRVAGPAGYDDRYFAYFAFPAYGLAYLAARGDALRGEGAADRPPHVHLPESGLALWRTADATVVVNHRLGRAAALLRSNAPALYHLGYTVTLNERRYSSAAWRGSDAPGVESTSSDGVSPFTAVSGGIPLRWLTIPFQIVVHVLVSGHLAEAFQSFLKRRMVHPARTIALTFERQVTVDADRLQFDDILRPAHALEVDGVAVTTEPSMHSPSARQDGSTSVALAADVAAAVREALRAGRPATVRWILNLRTGVSEAHALR